jgi:hypothetical protein
MTSFTTQRGRMRGRAAEGARRATGAALPRAGSCSGHGVFIFFQCLAFDLNNQFLQSDIHGGHDVLVSCFRRQRVLFSEDVQHPIASDEANQMVLASVRFGQRMTGSVQGPGEADRMSGQLQNGLRCLSFQFAVAIARIVLVFKSQRFSAQLLLTSHHNPSEKACLKVIIELFNNSIPPRLRHWNEPRLNVVEQTQTNQYPHTSRMLPAAIEDQLVVNLDIQRNSQTAPSRPDSIERVLPGLTQHRADRTASCRQIGVVQTVEAYRAFQSKTEPT